ncbi:MAG: hypothetical protein HYW02_08550 [Deltaproteobacteria bacterium]|nr:hypothetical protein [Deltaproteobacteria bacterium]MBI2501486.1 hypothetical protein [Deltaproteobacteria bacterium]
MGYVDLIQRGELDQACHALVDQMNQVIAEPDTTNREKRSGLKGHMDTYRSAVEKKYPGRILRSKEDMEGEARTNLIRFATKVPAGEGFGIGLAIFSALFATLGFGTLGENISRGPTAVGASIAMGILGGGGVYFGFHLSKKSQSNTKISYLPVSYDLCSQPVKPYP